MLIRRVAFAITLSLSVTAHAETLLDLEQLILQKQFETAYGIAEILEPKYAGDPNFDYLYGMAAIGTRQPEKAVLPLQRVLITDPDNAAARFELGRVYMAMHDHVLSRYHFQYAQGKTDNPDFNLVLSEYLKCVQHRLFEDQWRFTPSLQVLSGYDSNIAQVVNSDRVTISNAVIVLNGDARQQGDAFFDFSEGLNFEGHLTPNAGLFAKVLAHERIYQQKSHYNQIDGNIHGGLVFESMPHMLKIPLDVSTVLIDGAQYRSAQAFGIEWDTWYNTQSRFATTVQFGEQRHHQHSIANVNSFFSGIQAFLTSGVYPIALSPALFYLSDHAHHSDGDYYGRHVYGSMLKLDYRPYPVHRLTARHRYMFSQNTGLDPLGDLRRHDGAQAIMLEWNWNIYQGLAFLLGAEYTVNDSNIELYQFQRLESHLGFQFVYH